MKPEISVIIPTFNRRDSLLQTLHSLAHQTCPSEDFEIVVVDDGGTDKTFEAVGSMALSSLRYVRQENLGGVQARNRGAEAAIGQVLVFLDDDMTAASEYLEKLGGCFTGDRLLIARGQLDPWDGCTSVFALRYAAGPEQPQVKVGQFSSNNIAIRRDDFWSLGGWRDILPGVEEHRGGIWSDLEFAVRASKQGYRLVTVKDARIVHRDYAILTLDSACKRAYMISKLAVPVVRNCPGLMPYMPMLRDKSAVQWRREPQALSARKIARQIASCSLALYLMETAVPLLERHMPTSEVLLLLYRWIISGYIYHGYRDGLREVS